MKKRLPVILLLAVAFNACSAGQYALEKMLNMDDVSRTSAIPRLAKILEEGGANIIPCAAAQALFLMDTEDSRRILEKNLIYPHYNMDYSISLAYHWGVLAPAKRDQFIKAYHLKSRSEDAELRIKAFASNEEKGSIRFAISIINTSNTPLRFYKPHFYLGEHIILVSSTGEVMEPVLTTKYMIGRGSPEEIYPEVGVSNEMTFSFTAKVTSYSESPDPYFRSNLWFDCGDYSHKLTTTGTFRVYGRYDHKATRNPPFTNIWTGRVVSDPVEIIIQQPENTIPGRGKGD